MWQNKDELPLTLAKTKRRSIFVAHIISFKVLIANVNGSKKGKKKKKKVANVNEYMGWDS